MQVNEGKQADEGKQVIPSPRADAPFLARAEVSFEQRQVSFEQRCADAPVLARAVSYEQPQWQPARPWPEHRSQWPNRARPRPV